MKGDHCEVTGLKLSSVMSKGSNQGGLLMFKKSFTEAIQNKDAKSHNARVKERIKKPQDPHDRSESEVISYQDTCGESKSRGISQYDHRVGRLRGRGRGQAQLSHNESVPRKGVKSSSCAMPRKTSSRSHHICQKYEDSWTSEVRDGECRPTSVEVRHSDSKVEPHVETLHVFNRRHPTHLQNKKLNGYNGQRQRFERSEASKLTPSPPRQMKENRKPEKGTSAVHKTDKAKNGYPIKDKACTPSALMSVKQTDGSFLTDEEPWGYHEGTFEKIQNMYKMYEERTTDESRSSFLQNQQIGLEIKLAGTPENNAFINKLSHQTQAGQTDSHETIERNHSDTGQRESTELVLVSKRKERLSSTSENMAPESGLACLNTIESLGNAVENLSISENFQNIPDNEILILQEEIPLQDMESQSDMTNQEEVRDVYRPFSEESPALDENVNNNQEASASFFSEFGTSPEMEVFSQSESEPEDASHGQTNEPQENSNIYNPFFYHHPLYSSFSNYFNHHEVSNNQCGAQKKHSYPESAFHPHFYPNIPNPSTPAFNFSHPHAFAARGGPPPLIIPSESFGSRESMDLTMRYVVTQRRRYEEYAENCYGYCAPLEVVISVRESPLWTGTPYSRPNHCPPPWPHHVPPAFWPASHWQHPVFRGSYAQTDPSSYSQSAASGQYHEPVEETVDQDGISAEADDASFPEEIEEKKSVSNTKPDKPHDSGVQALQGKELSDDESGSCYSTANSEDIPCSEETCNCNTNLKRGIEQTHVNKVTVEKETKITIIKRMDAKNKETNIDLQDHHPNSITPEKCTSVNGRLSKAIKKLNKVSNGGCSVSSFLTAEHLQNDWKTSVPPQSSAPPFAMKNNPLRGDQPTTPLSNNWSFSSSPSPSRSRKRRSNALGDRGEYSQGKEAKFLSSNRNLPTEASTVENTRDTSCLSERSVSPRSNSDSIYFSPSWPGTVASPESAEASHTSPLACSSNVVKQNHQIEMGQRSRSRSLSSDGNKKVYRTSAQSKVPPMYSPVPVPGTQDVVSYPNGQFVTPPSSSRSPRDTWLTPSPCNHLRRSLDWTDKWKVALHIRSKSYNHTFIDSHCHIDFLYSRINSPAVPFEDFIAKHSDSFPANYEGCISVFCNPKTFSNYRPDGNDILNVVSKEKGIWIAAGCHPKNAMDFRDEHMNGLIRILKECPKVVALGEIGLDYSGKFHQYHDVQKQVFRRQLIMAVHLNFPLVIHCRDADADCLQIMQEIVPRHHKIHAHCFTRDLAMAHKWMSLFPNLYLGLTPVITYKSAHDAIQTAAGIPLERLLLETDAPYFVPAGVHLCSTDKYSHPGMALYTAETIALLKGIPVDKVLKAARENTHIVYGI